VHSSLRDQGISAVEIAAEMISFLNRLQTELNEAERHDGFDFPFSSVHTGMIHGGTAHNITAQDCEFKFEIRALPGVDASVFLNRLKEYAEQTLLPPMLQVSDQCSINITEIVNSPGLADVGNKNLAQAIMPLCNCLEVGRVSFGTEAGWVTEGAGVPTVVCGPGDINVAHQPDEFVEIDQLHQCMSFLDKIGQRATEKPSA
jgi:acetylornithine deacetylase